MHPLAAKLIEPDGGPEYLQIQAEIYTRPGSIAHLVPRPEPGSSIPRWHALLDPLVPEEERTVLHSRFPAIRFAFVELARRAATAPHDHDDGLFVSHLVDLVTALLAVRPSPATTRLLDGRSIGARGDS